VTTALTDVTSISFFVSEKRPTRWLRHIKSAAGTVPSVANRLKMAKTCNVTAIVESGGKLYSATRKSRSRSAAAAASVQGDI